MFPVAELSLYSGGWIAWIIIGLIAGWLTGLLMGSGGYGFIGDLILGLIGALIGGFVTSFFVEGQTGFWGTVLVSILGAVILVILYRAMTRRHVFR